MKLGTDILSANTYEDGSIHRIDDAHRHVVLWSKETPDQYVAEGRGVYNIRRSE